MVLVRATWPCILETYKGMELAVTSHIFGTAQLHFSGQNGFFQETTLTRFS